MFRFIPPCRQLLTRFWLLTVLGSGMSGSAAEPSPMTVDDQPSTETDAGPAASDPTDAAIRRALSLLEVASAGSADERTCFTCHSQAHPVLALVEARRRGFEIDSTNLDRQLEHTAAHLKRGRADYLAGRGQGGKADTAGYALWTLQAGGVSAPETTDPVVGWLFDQQLEAGNWKRSSDRPPSEASHFTTTYLALRAIGHFADDDRQASAAKAFERAQRWLIDHAGEETEDRVFRLLALQAVDAPEPVQQAAADALLRSQQDDGGWSQIESLTSDAYATGTVLVALFRSGHLTPADPRYQNGIGYLVDHQQDDGSWHVVSRSRPFQTYYETGFPHGDDQFISTSATAWATTALLLTRPASPAADNTPTGSADPTR